MDTLLDVWSFVRVPTWYTLLTVGVAYVTWLLYGLIMHLKIVRDRLHPAVKALAMPVVVVGLVFDVALNVLVSPIFRELPREWLLTARLKRYRRGGGSRAWKAYLICEYLLNPFDPDHC